MIDLGTGSPVVLVPGIQGRWEWMRPAVTALAARARVISFSLLGEPGSGADFNPSEGFDSLVAQIDVALDRAGLAAATMCGVSFGGLVAMRYAATRPGRTRALVLVSTPGPQWMSSTQLRRSISHPWLLFPQFFVGAGYRAWQELSETFANKRERIRMAGRYAGLIVAAPTTPARMSQRAASALGLDFTADCARIAAPTLIVIGDPAMDRVVPPATTLEYARLIREACTARLEATGHLGIITKPRQFADLVADFMLRADMPRRESGTASWRQGAGLSGH